MTGSQTVLSTRAARAASVSPRHSIVALSVPMRRLAPPVSKTPGSTSGPERVADDRPARGPLLEQDVVVHAATFRRDRGDDHRRLARGDNVVDDHVRAQLVPWVVSA